MKLLFDFFPVIIFFAAFKLFGIYTATAASIAAAVIQVAVHWLRTRRFETTHLITLGVLAVFGSLTLILHDATFIKWKPTVVNWVFAAVVLASQFTRKTVLERLLGQQVSLPPAIWRRTNLSWGVFFLAMGALNLYVAFYYAPNASPEAREALWVNFKVFGMLGLTLVFVLLQGIWLAKHMEKTDKGGE